jgi:TolB-like protein/Tfp pilus assembly protein PilF
MSFFNELKRRNVIRVGIAYAVVAWLLLQLADVLKELLSLPDEVGRTVVLLLLIGFIPALVFAWAFELTPEGLKRDAEVDRSRSVAPHTGRKLDRLIIVVLTIALAGFAWDRFGRDAGSGSASVSSEQPLATDPALAAIPAVPAISPEKSIAVLPFVNMSGNTDNEYFSDGLSEELLNLLARVNGLKVAARTSSFKFKNSNADIAEIGRALNVATVLEGSVRRSGDRARITAQLIKVNDGFHLWSETFDRQLDDIFAVQDEIASAIVEALKLPLLGQDAAPLQSDEASTFQAYDLYLLGQFSSKNWNQQDLSSAIDYYQRAIALDADFAPAWAGLANSYALLQDFGNMSREEALRLGQAAADTALALQPMLPEALTARAMLLRYTNRSARAGETARQALEIDPNNVGALQMVAITSLISNPQLALEFATRAYELDPLNGPSRRALLQTTGLARNRIAEAEALARDMLAGNPDDPDVFEGLADAYRFRSLYVQAIHLYQRTWQERPGDVYPGMRLVQLYLEIGDVQQAEYWAGLARERGGPNSAWADDAQDHVDLYLGNAETLLARNRQALPAERVTRDNVRLRLASALLQSGRQSDAEQQLRLVLQNVLAPGQPFDDIDQVAAASMLAGLLAPGAEKDKLTTAVRRFAADRQQMVPSAPAAYVFAAIAAAADGQREELLRQLEQALAQGWVDSWFLRNHPALRDWQDDPLLVEILLNMDARAASTRAAVAAQGNGATT